MLSVYVLRFMTLGSKINSKFTNTSGLLTEQVSIDESPLYHVSGKRIGFPPEPRRGPPPPPPPWVGGHFRVASSPGRSDSSVDGDQPWGN